jgi:hypothetical protein
MHTEANEHLCQLNTFLISFEPLVDGRSRNAARERVGCDEAMKGVIPSEMTGYYELSLLELQVPTQRIRHLELKIFVGLSEVWTSRHRSVSTVDIGKP